MMANEIDLKKLMKNGRLEVSFCFNTGEEEPTEAEGEEYGKKLLQGIEKKFELKARFNSIHKLLASHTDSIKKLNKAVK